MLRCPEGLCNVRYRNDKKSLETRAKHGTHLFSFASVVRNVDVNPARGFDPRGVQYLLRGLAR